MTMRPITAWGRFYAEQRLLVYVQQARTIGNLSRHGPILSSGLRTADCREFDDVRSPSSIHGDIWAGSLIFAAEGVVLIDPPPMAAVVLLILRCCICSDPRSWR
jgi:fructosamine-3-kinase